MKTNTNTAPNATYCGKLKNGCELWDYTGKTEEIARLRKMSRKSKRKAK